MTWIDKLERRLGHLAIPHMLRWVALLNGLVFVLVKLSPEFLNHLTLDPRAIMEGEVWRLVSHIFIPRIGGLFPKWIEVLFYLMFLNWLGDGLEESMGAFQLNLYYVLGMVGTTVAAFLTGRGDGFLLNNSLLFAFVWFYPDMKVYVLLLLPLKVKWLAVLDIILVGVYFFAPGWSHKLGILASLANFGLFFGPRWIEWRRQRAQMEERRERYVAESQMEESLHCCVVCGCTEVTMPDAEFRVARDGQEYCQAHIKSSQLS